LHTKDLAEQNVISSRIFKGHKGHAAISLCSDQNWFALDPFTNTNVEPFFSLCFLLFFFLITAQARQLLQDILNPV
jgi:hypothetical protein